MEDKSFTAADLNGRAVELTRQIILHSRRLNVGLSQVGGANVLDFTDSNVDGGKLLALLCMSDLGSVEVRRENLGAFPWDYVHVRTGQPIAACIHSQLAGQVVAVGDYFAMASGPFRAASASEALFKNYGIAPGELTRCVAVLETRNEPTQEVVRYLSGLICGPSDLTVAFAPTSSVAALVQIAARCVETALHKLKHLEFDLRKIVSGEGSCPMAPTGTSDPKGDTRCIGTSNDSIFYGGEVTLHVTGCSDDELAVLATKVPASTSTHYGDLFYDVMKSVKWNFYAIDPGLFAPAKIALVNDDTGITHVAGAFNMDVLKTSFGLSG